MTAPHSISSGSAEALEYLSVRDIIAKHQKCWLPCACLDNPQGSDCAALAGVILAALASSPSPQIAGDVREKVARSAIGVLDNRIGGINDMRDATEAGYEIADAILALSPPDAAAAVRSFKHDLATTAPPFSRWADIIESASLTISPKGSKELDALAAEVRAGGVAQRPLRLRRRHPVASR